MSTETKIDLPNPRDIPRRPVSRILFPRFETVDDPDKPIYRQEVRSRAQAMSWLTPDEVQLLLHPAQVTGTVSENMKAKNNWWGVQHHATTQTTLGRPMTSPFNPDGQQPLL